MVSKVIFYYGVMNSSKSAQLLMQNYNYKEQGLNTLLIKPEIDNREGVDVISSRIGLKENSDWTIKSEDTYTKIQETLNDKWSNSNVILVDEAQFFSPAQIAAIVLYAREFNIEVHAFGLLKDFTNTLFKGSQEWIELADNMIEIKTTCSKCTKKATCNLRLDENGNPVYVGNVIKIGGNNSYISVCAEHYTYYALCL